MTTACGKHPQARLWESLTGPRCAICGDVLTPGTVTPREPMRVHHLDTFQKNTRRTSTTWKHGYTFNPEQAHLLQAAMGLGGEAGEFVERVKKILLQGHEMTDELKAKLREEVGDIMWYAADAACALEALLSDIASANEAKLQRRYPDGFTPEASVARVDTQEQ
jgi:NTP pyrophosphatase (non-canonical NTP hydrolase)